MRDGKTTGRANNYCPFHSPALLKTLLSEAALKLFGDAYLG